MPKNVVNDPDGNDQQTDDTHPNTSTDNTEVVESQNADNSNDSNSDATVDLNIGADPSGDIDENNNIKDHDNSNTEDTVDVDKGYESAETFQLEVSGENQLPPHPAAGPKPVKHPRLSSKEKAFKEAVNEIQKQEQRSYKYDSIDKECARFKITYKRWKGTNDPKDYTHPSHLPFGTSPIISREQNLNDECVLCLRKRIVEEGWDVCHHYKSVHADSHLVVRDIIMMACKCSEVHSRGWAKDKAMRNWHHHCIICHHPRNKPRSNWMPHVQKASAH